MKVFLPSTHEQGPQHYPKYKKMFELDAWKPSNTDIDPKTYLETIGDAQDFLFFSGNDKLSSKTLAGYTYLGQLIAHDMSYDNSPLQGNSISIDNRRTPALDLDSVYGGGPEKSPHLYNEKEGFIFKLIKQHTNDNAAFIKPYYDFPNSGRIPVLADQRNDENIILSQLQIVLMLLHNHFIQELKKDLSGLDLFREARQKTVWHYQYVIVTDYLSKILCNKQLIRISRSSPAPMDFIPLEFAGAAFRFGHSQVRPTYQLRPQTTGRRAIIPDLRYNGLQSCVDWRLFFGDGVPEEAIDPRHNLRISPILMKGLWLLDFWGETINLFKQDLLRGLKYELPSGQDIASYIAASPIPEDRWMLLDSQFEKFPVGPDPKEFQKNTPLIYYILAEAELMEDGQKLGEVGSYIVAQTILGLLKADPNSYLNLPYPWKPNRSDCALDGSTFTMKELVKLAGAEEGVIAPEDGLAKTVGFYK